MDHRQPRSPQIKVCGLTVPDEAAACAALGADAIGLVFFRASPRHVTLDQAARITAALPAGVCPVGVFVDPERELLERTIAGCGLKAVQLHGRETPELAAWLRERFQVTVLKALFVTRQPPLSAADRYDGANFLVECGRGALPGGNAMTWDWRAAEDFARCHPTLLAGGLDPDNVGQAIAAALPDGVDASSGLEAVPGRKDLKKVERFVAAVRTTAGFYADRPKPLAHLFGNVL